MENNFLRAGPDGNHSFTRIVNHRDDDLRPGKDFWPVGHGKANLNESVGCVSSTIALTLDIYDS